MDKNWGDLCDEQEADVRSKVEKLKIESRATSAVTPVQTSLASNGSGDAAASAAAALAAAASAAAAASSHSTVPQAANTEASTVAGDKEEEKTVSKEEESLLRKILRSKLVTTKADLEVLRKDPNSPLFSVKSFEALNLKKELLKGLYDMGFNAPSKIQETALPSLLADPPVNMIAQSQSGTGKTAAFVLTMLSRVDSSKHYPQCLCLAPTYELAVQIGQVTEQMAKHMKEIIIKYAIKGNRIDRGQKITEQIIIGTPGTLMDWAIKYKFFDLRKIKVFVLDEADVMIATQGHQDQSIRIQKGLSLACQMLLFSATYDGDVMEFAQAVIPNNPVTIRLRREEESLNNIRQYFIECRDIEDKYRALSNIYGTISIGQSMVFCHTRKNAAWLAEKMTKDGHVVGLLTGDLAIEQRADIIKRFRDGKEKILITTNVSARGIDVEMVTVVVNFDLPVLMDGKPDCETYLHRIGRTGRFGKSGIAINFVDGTKSMNNLKVIEKHFGRNIIKLDAEDMDEIEKIGT